MASISGPVDRRTCLAGLAFLPGLAWSAPSGAGLVDSIAGSAVAAAGAGRRDLSQSSPVFVGDRIDTGPSSRVAMTLGELTRLRLGAECSITIDRFVVRRGGDITLGQGALLFDRPSDAPPQAISIRSGFGAIAVRGTEFFAGPSNNVFGVFVVRGKVTVRAAGRAVTLEGGEGTDIASPGARPTPPVRWGAPRIAAALASVT